MGLIARLLGREAEATAQQIATSGAGGYALAADDVDANHLSHYRRAGAAGRRDVPYWTRDRLVTHSIAAYRTNPMARAIIDTYTTFCVGDSGVRPESDVDEVQRALDKFWGDPMNHLHEQDLLLRSYMLHSEKAIELMTGDISGVTRMSLIDTTRVRSVELLAGNPLWPSMLRIGTPGDDVIEKPIVMVDDLTGLRKGEVLWSAGWRTSPFDTRGVPFLAPIIDWLDSVDEIMWNLVDRTALARHIVFDVTLEGAGPEEIKKFISDRGGTHAPKSGKTEIHNEKVDWNVMQPQVGSYEDANTQRQLLTQVSAGAGLARTWLAEPEGANRATSLTMAEPVRRRVGGVQDDWLRIMGELCRYQIDQLVETLKSGDWSIATNAREFIHATSRCEDVAKRILERFYHA